MNVPWLFCQALLRLRIQSSNSAQLHCSRKFSIGTCECVYMLPSILSLFSHFAHLLHAPYALFFFPFSLARSWRFTVHNKPWYTGADEKKNSYSSHHRETMWRKGTEKWQQLVCTIYELHMYGNKFICTPRCNRLGLCHLALSFACSFPQFVVGIVPIAHSSFFRSPAFSCIIHFKYVYHQQFEEKTMATICSEYTNSNRTALFFFASISFDLEVFYMDSCAYQWF